jgi:hypothetical protein
VQGWLSHGLVGALGVALGVSAWACTAADEPAPAPSTAVEPCPACPACPDTPTQTGSCDDELALLRDKLAFARAQVVSLGGAFSEWPEAGELSDELRPSAVRAWVDGALEPSMGQLELLDCDEFPCVAVLRLPDDAPASSSVVQPLASRFADEHGLSGTSVHVSMRPDGAWALVPLGPDLAPFPDAEARLSARVEELVEVVAEPLPD